MRCDSWDFCVNTDTFSPYLSLILILDGYLKIIRLLILAKFNKNVLRV